MAECLTLPPELGASFNGSACGAAEPGEQPRFPAYVRVLVTLACSLILAVGVVGNVLVPLVIWRNRELRNSTNFFLLNLSLADLFVLLLCMPKVLVEVHTRPEVWILGRTVCLMVPFLEQLVVNVSVLTIMAISMERYYAICKPLRAGYTWTKMRALVVIVIVWLAAIVTSSPILWIVKFEMVDYTDNTKVPVCATMAHTTLNQMYYISKDVTFFFLPVLVLLVLYSVITLHLIREPRTEKFNFRISRSHDPRNGAETSNYRARKQVVFMLIAVIICFFFCMLPSCVFRLFIIIASEETIYSLGWETYHNINFFCRIMTYINCSMNPILYNVMSSKFREAFLKVLGVPPVGRHLSRQSTFNTASSTASSRLNSVLRAEAAGSPAAGAGGRYGRQSSCASVLGRGGGRTLEPAAGERPRGSWQLERIHSLDPAANVIRESSGNGSVDCV